MKTSSFDLFGSVTTFMNRFNVGRRKRSRHAAQARRIEIVEEVDRNAPTLLRNGAQRRRP